jgi:hypothetical protein
MKLGKPVTVITPIVELNTIALELLHVCSFVLIPVLVTIMKTGLKLEAEVDLRHYILILAEM